MGKHVLSMGCGASIAYLYWIQLAIPCTKVYNKNRSAMRTWGLMLNFIPFGWNVVLKHQHLGVDLLQVKR